MRFINSPKFWLIAIVAVIVGVAEWQTSEERQVKPMVEKQSRAGMYTWENEPLADFISKGDDHIRKIAMAFCENHQRTGMTYLLFAECLKDAEKESSKTLLNDALAECRDGYNKDFQAFRDKYDREKWVKASDLKDPDQVEAERLGYDRKALERQFSRWDGSHGKTEALIKAGMKNPRSYEHVKTRFGVETYPNGKPYLLVHTQFRGTNSFGAIVTNDILVEADIATGDIIKVVENH